MKTYHCLACDRLLSTSPDLPDGPCPRCGHSAVSISDSEDSRPLRVAGLRTKSLIPGTRKWTVLHADYISVFQDTGEEHFVSRTIDRAADYYHEKVIVRATGRTVREVGEPLSSHTGRGSAKKNSD